MNSLLIAYDVTHFHQPPIDRNALVRRHNVDLAKFDGERSLQVGNGEFALGMDFTGMQSIQP